MKYMINYDLNKAGKNYDGLHEVIRSFPYYHALDSGWFIKTTLSAQQVYDKLAPKIDADDYLLVSEVNANRQGYLKPTAWEFLNS